MVFEAERQSLKLICPFPKIFHQALVDDPSNVELFMLSTHIDCDNLAVCNNRAANLTGKNTDTIAYFVLRIIH